MNKKHIFKPKSLFAIAEDRLIEKVKRGEIKDYSISDIIELSINARKYIDKNPVLKIPSLTAEEKRLKTLTNKYTLGDYSCIKRDTQPHTNKKYLIYE